jgi:hypothetical protein
MRFSSTVFRAGALALAALGMAHLTSCKQQSDKVSVHWQTSPIKIDGHFEDWDSIATSRMHGDHAVLKLVNDSQNLCLYYITDDINWVRTIKMTGLTVYFNHTGTHDKEFFIRYRNGPPIEELIARSPAPMAGSHDDMNPAMREQLLESERTNRTEFSCFVRDWIVEKSIPTDGRQGPEAAYGKQAGGYAYEFRIPLKASEALFYGLGLKPGEPFGMGAEWGGMPRPVLNETPPGSQDFGGNLGGSSSPDDFGAGGSTPPAGGTPPGLPEREEVWIKAHLADIAHTEPQP